MISERHARQLAEARASANTPEGRKKRGEGVKASWDAGKRAFPSWLHSPEARKKAADALRVPVEVRFYKYASPEPNSGCWLWLGSCDTLNYGQLRIDKALRYASHISLELSGRHRSSPEHVARHKCDNPNCVNPDHLEWGTQKQNMGDAIERGRMDMTGLEYGRGWNAGLKQTHCKRGHAREVGNISSDGSCRICKNLMKREARNRKNGRTSASPTIEYAAKRVILRLIDLETDPAERKAKIMIAREEGVISDYETADLIRRYALVFA